MTKRKERSPMTDAGKGDMKSQRAATEEVKNYKKTESGQESNISDNAATEINKKLENWPGTTTRKRRTR
eukprot:2316274-Heterocapsa_arctica.AAC.1